MHALAGDSMRASDSMNLKLPAAVPDTPSVGVAGNAAKLPVFEPSTAALSAHDGLELLSLSAPPDDEMGAALSLVRGAHKPERIVLRVKFDNVQQVNVSRLDGP